MRGTSTLDASKGEGLGRKAAAAFLLVALAALASAQTPCAHCAMPIPRGDAVGVEMGGKKVMVRCMLCARDLAAQSPGAARVTGPTEDPARPLAMVSNDRGEWTSNLPDVVFLEVEGDHALCNRWSRAFTSRGAFDVYVAAHPEYKDAKPLTLAEWSAKEGAQDMDHMDMGGMKMDGMGSMRGVLGPWSMAREGSGTSWLPDDSPMFMKMLPKKGRYALMYMGNFSLNYTDSNASNGRGPHEFYSNSMPMLMARREFAGGDTLGLRIMGSLDPIFNGQFGAPNLFQTGETAHGQELVDRQHPHDLIAEVSATYSKPIGSDRRAFVYLAPIGEPALAGSMYLMRPSGMENPEAPISHHWFDSSHITFGVATAGLTFGDRWKLDGSVFKGREPDENRYSPDDVKFDSGSARASYNPSRALSLSVSYASLQSPEAQSPDEDEARTTAAVSYGKAIGGRDWLAATAYWGRDAHGGHVNDAYLAEATLYRGDWSTYFRYENVAKDELGGVPEGTYKVNKVTLGTTRDFSHRGGFDLGVGGYVGLYAFPSDLQPFYGKTPVSLGVYLRLRTGRMNHAMARMSGMGTK